ncbi:MAG: hypothetical protein C0601_02415 [Candidatus Muiribacterium halophilum]|uniref:HEAT repeat domain-containing protein n=1 Tax=Muiribacterium halophilum TaxID=2053465 RepID=A0A2N5ZKQ8_MUIH1|nr:MAG: hypothetical protein C0601_02415 [Candidatus Muirbacterium halophilum]
MYNKCMSIDKMLSEKLYNPSKAVRFEALKNLVKRNKMNTSSLLRKFLLFEKDKELIFYARKSLDILSKNLRKKITPFDITDHEFIQALYSNDNAAKIDTMQKIIKLRKKKYLPYLIEKTKTEDDIFVIATLVKAIGYLGSEENIDLLCEFLKSPDGRVRANTVEALAVIGGEKVLPVVLPMLEDKHPRVKITTANYLISNSDDINIDNIIEKYSRSNSLPEKAAVIFLIDKIRAPRYANVLMLLSKDKNKVIAKDAQSALKKISKIQDTAENIDEFAMLEKLSVDRQPDPLTPDSRPKSHDTFFSLVEKLFDSRNPDDIKKTILKLERLGDTRAIEKLNVLESNSKVVNYFKKRAIDKLSNIEQHITTCPNCGFQIRKEKNEA